MSHIKTAGSLVYLMENLTDARLRCDQVKRYLAKVMKLVEQSTHRDHFYEVAGDILYGAPESLFKLDKALDATALAASRLDYEELKQQLSPEKVDELEGVLKDVRVKHLERRSLPENTVNRYKAASANHVTEAILRVASEVENATISPKEASLRLARVRMALSQTAQQAVEAMGSVQADSREKVMDGFKKSNPALSEADLEEIADQWESNKSVVKDQHKTAAKREQLDPSKPLEGNAVAFFYVGGDEKEGDPESVDLKKGEVPLKVVEKYLERRLGDGSEVSAKGSNELACKAKGYDGKPYSYTTSVKVEARKKTAAQKDDEDDKDEKPWEKNFAKKKEASFPAAPRAHIVNALRRIASKVQSHSIAPNDARTQLAFVRVALSQTAQQAVEAMGSVQADSREKVMDGFKKSNPALSEADLEEIADQWEKNKDVVKGKTAAQKDDKDEDDKDEKPWEKNFAKKKEASGPFGSFYAQELEGIKRDRVKFEKEEASRIDKVLSSIEEELQEVKYYLTHPEYLRELAEPNEVKDTLMSIRVRLEQIGSEYEASKARAMNLNGVVSRLLKDPTLTTF